jgi:hypothetical protein
MLQRRTLSRSYAELWNAMKISELSHLVLRALAAAPALLLLVTPIDRAQAFGAVGASAGAEIEQTGEQLILIDNPDSTVTAVIQLQLSGAAEDLTWVIPVPAEPTLTLSSSTVFQRLVSVTSPQYWVELTDPCTVRDPNADIQAEEEFADTQTGAPDESPARVKIIEQTTLGPYEYSSFRIAADGGNQAISSALAERGFAWDERDSQQLTPYVQAGMTLLAIKLKKAAATAINRPIAITYESTELTIPIRATRSAARADMPLRVWLFGDAHAVPANYQTLIVNDALLDWQSAQKFPNDTAPSNGAGAFGPRIDLLSNYDAVIGQAADAARDGQGFFVEHSSPTSHVRDIVWSVLDIADAERVLESGIEGIDVVQRALESFRSWDGLRAVIERNVQLPEGATHEQLMADPAAFRGTAQVDAARFLEQLESEVLAPVRNTAALMRRTPYMTQLFSTLSADEMTLDPTFQWNPDLALVGNVHIAKQYLICEPGDDAKTADWRMELPQGGVVVGSGRNGWPVALDAMPANLMVVELTSEGSGKLIQDNREAMGRAMYAAAGRNGTGAAIPLVPQNGLTIGQDQTVIPQLREGTGQARQPRSGALQVSRDVCSTVVARGQTAPGACWVFAGMLGLLRLHRRGRRQLAALILVLLGACSDDEAAKRLMPDASFINTTGALTAEQLRNPEACKDCHPSHYREWSGSMHAFASRDPVFRAMNQRGQRETGGELGDFCVKCHAPMAVFDKQTSDGLNLDDLGHEDRGVTCYFCHSVVAVEGTHNAQLRIAADTTLRGPFDNALPTLAHGTEKSKHFDENAIESSQMCGACHDIVMPKGVAIERTFKEYEASLFAKSGGGDTPPFGTCVGCHMAGRKSVVADVPGAPVRITHEHFWPGIDVAFGDFPHREAMRSAIEDCQLGTASVAYFSVEVSPPDLFTFLIETNAGHNQPSGASQDRRMWIELLAYDEAGNLIPEASSGNIADGELEEKPPSDPKHDPQLVLFGDRIFDENGKRVHMFWDAAKSAAYPKGYESLSLPPASTTYVEGKHVVVKQLRAAGPNGLPARVTARLRIRPIGIDVLDDLVQSGDLDPAIVAEMPTMTFGAQLAWSQADGLHTPIYAQVKNDCGTYRCLLDPNDTECQ